MTTDHIEKFVNALACDLEEGGFRQVSGTTLRRSLTEAVSAALPLLEAGNPVSELAEQQGEVIVQALADAYAAGAEGLQFGGLARRDTLIGALAATGKQQVGEESAGQPETCRSDRKAQVEQVGEVQGDALPALPYPNYPVSKTGLQNNLYTASQMQDYARAALAARQPVGAAEQLDRALGETIDQRDRYHEVADDLAGHIERITGVEIGEHSSDNCPWQNAIDAAESYTPAQGIDLGQIRELLERRRRQWKTHLPQDPNAPGTRAIRTIVPPHGIEGETDYNNDVALYREGIAVMDEALALIDSQRDAAPGLDS